MNIISEIENFKLNENSRDELINILNKINILRDKIINHIIKEDVKKIDEENPENKELIENHFSQKKKNNVKSNNDEYSLSFLVKDHPINFILTQSDKIKLGNECEQLLVKHIIKKSNFTDIKPKNKKGESEKDHLFENELKVIYSEIKSNIYLDTEKRKATKLKIKKINEELKTEYKNKLIESYLVATRYLNKIDIPLQMSTKSYSEINLISVNDYLEKFGIQNKFTEEEYKNFILKIYSCIIYN